MTAICWCNISDVLNMQITNPVVCDTSKGSLYKINKSPLVDEHAFPLTSLQKYKVFDSKLPQLVLAASKPTHRISYAN